MRKVPRMRTFKERREMPRVAVCKERWAWMSWRREEAVSEPWVQEVLWLPRWMSRAGWCHKPDAGREEVALELTAPGLLPDLGGW